MGADSINPGAGQKPPDSSGINVANTASSTNPVSPEILLPELLRECLNRLSTPDQIQLSGVNKFFYKFISEGLLHLTRVIPLEHTEFRASALKSLRERFPALQTLRITGTLNPEKMASLAEHWVTLTEGLAVEIHARPANSAPDPDINLSALTLRDDPDFQMAAPGATLFQLFESLSKNPAEHSPITQLNLSGLGLRTTKNECEKFNDAFTEACKSQHFSQLRVLNLSKVRLEVYEDEEQVRQASTQFLNEITGETLLEQFLKHSPFSQLRELRATNIYLNGVVLGHLADALEKEWLPNLEVLDLSQISNLFYFSEINALLHQFIAALAKFAPSSLKELHLPPASSTLFFADLSKDLLTAAFKNKKFQALERLNINFLTGAFDPYYQDLMANLDKCPRLQEIHSAGNYLRGDEFNDFCNHLENHLRNLKRLDLSRPWIADRTEAAPSLIRLINALVGNRVAAPSQLESLKLSQWPCNLDEAKALRTTITDESCLPKLKHFSLPCLHALPDEQQLALFSSLESRGIRFDVQQMV